jgi:hypothetical protein
LAGGASGAEGPSFNTTDKKIAKITKGSALAWARHGGGWFSGWPRGGHRVWTCEVGSLAPFVIFVIFESFVVK